MKQTVLLVGAFDSKGLEYSFVRKLLQANQLHVLTVNTGVLGTTDLFPVDIEAAEVAEAAGSTLEQLREAGDRGEAMKTMAAGVAVISKNLFSEDRVDAVFGMGGSGGSTMVTAAMRCLPLGIPKVCVCTVASGDTSIYVGASDIVLYPSATDVAGVNRISRVTYTRAIGCLLGMLQTKVTQAEHERPIVVASMFGNTTACVDACRQQLDDQGYEVLVFHAVGTGGQTMESLIEQGLVDACLDITTTEWADELCGGVFSAGTARLEAAGKAGIPHLIVPGCVDMVNFNAPDSIPQKYQNAGRQFYHWNPSVTLMRTNLQENRQLGEIFAAKANQAKGPIAFLLPLKGISILDGDGELFCDREADQALFQAIRENVREGIPVHELDANINDPEFATRAVELLLEMRTEDKDKCE